LALLAEPLQSDLASVTNATRVRLRFAKRGDLRLVSHHDLLRCLERMLKRTGLPIAHSHGFNPRAKAVFPLALALGIEGRREVLDLDLAEAIEPAEVLRRLQAQSPAGFDFEEAIAVPLGRAPQVAAVRYELPIPQERRDTARAAVAQFLKAGSQLHTRRREGRAPVEIDLRSFVLEAEIDHHGSLQLRMKIDPDRSARPEEVIESLGLKDLLEQGAFLIRTDVELALPGGSEHRRSSHDTQSSLRDHA
jgi:radical SAM-linked protein